MENIKKFIKSTKAVSRIFIALWLFMCASITLSFLIRNPRESIIYDITYLLICYGLYSVMFLIPAVTITQAQCAKMSAEEIQYSEKSYWGTLLLAVFFGLFGVHRFCTGKKVTGLIYLFTFGGGVVGWLVDIVLIAAGMFLDEKGNIIQLPRHNTQKIDITPHSTTIHEASKYTENPQKPEESHTVTTLFSDVVISGSTEQRQEIPLQENSLFTTTSYVSYSSKKFLNDMKKYVDIVGQKAEFVPFMQYWPTYDSMDRRQRAWYFYWRTQVRNGQYPDTDLSYIFVHIYELLSGYGWVQAINGYRQLMSLWISYRERFPKLDNYLFEWIFDFTTLHHLNFTIPEIRDFQLPSRLVVIDLLVGQHSEEIPLKLPFSLICSLCDYSIISSKFYKDDHQQLLQEAIPRVVALSDAVLRKEKGKGILAIYGPNRPKKQYFNAFQSAICPNANKRIELSVKSYSTSPKLRNYVNQLVRYSENVLRSLYGYRGRLRDIDIEPELSIQIKNFLKKEYEPKEKTENSHPKKVEVKLDFESIKNLRVQSNAVRDALEVEDEDRQKELLESEIVMEQKAVIATELHDTKLDGNSLSEELKQFVGLLTDTQKQVLQAILLSDDSQKIITQLAEEVMSMPEILIDEINEVATQFLDDILIDVLDDTPTILEQYAEELKRLVQ